MMRRLAVILAVGLCVPGCVRDRVPAQAHNRPLSSPGAQFASLPPAAQNAIRAEAGTAEITNIRIDRTSGSPVYVVHFREELIYPVLRVSQNGSVLRPDNSVAVGAADTLPGVIVGAAANLKPADLPAEVAREVETRLPGVEITSVNKELWGERPIYIISFADPAKHPRMYILSDGTVLQAAAR